MRNLGVETPKGVHKNLTRILKKFMKTKVWPFYPADFLHFFFFFFFFNERYLDTECQQSLKCTQLPPTRFYSVHFLWDTFTQVTFEFSSSSSNECILIVSLKEHSVDQDLSFDL
jgi:hypothetical protein